MEFLGKIIEVLKCFWGPICRYIDHHRKLEENVNQLRTRVKDLNDRKHDLESCQEAENRRSKEVKKEVEKWFEPVKRMNNEMQKIEEKFRIVSYFSRAHLGKHVCQKIEEAERIYQQGNFTEGVAVGGPPATGVTVSTPYLEGEINVKEQIWKYLMGDKVGMIGVCGMGGIGKTTIMKHIKNQILKDNQFEKIIWVTVSKELNIFKLQEEIANSMKQSLPLDQLQRAAKLKEILEGKRYVLILDDVWESFSLLDVGISKTTLGEERKVVLTSRSIEVCKSMGCEVVKVQPLSEKESMNLFLDHVGHSVIQDQNLKDIVNLIIDQCSGLPLAIVTIACSMKGVDDIWEWRNALNELEERGKSVKGLNTKIFECLKFSYDHLGDPKIQNCFLYCSLYPEDCEIEKLGLIESWIDEGLLDGLETRQAMHDRGRSILSKLENNCLLEKAIIRDWKDEEVIEVVKVHDVLRDMALYIKSAGHQFIVKAGMSMMELPSEHEWKENLEKVSLIDSSMSEIPPQMSPKCPHLSTLLLQVNVPLTSILEPLFKHLPGLKVLNLSLTGITHLPNSISNLKSLNALILAHCYKLRCVPSLTELIALKKLDLSDTDIEEVPHGIEMLENLTYLSLGSVHLKELPAGMLPTISHLQCLLIKGVNLRGEEVGELRKLETLSCSFCDMQEFEKYEKSIQGKCPANFYVEVGLSAGDRFLEFMVVPNLKELQKQQRFLVPNGRNLKIRKCHDFKCLSNIALFHQATDLKRCDIQYCEGIECVVDFNALHNIESLELRELCNLRELVRVGVAVESTSHAPTPPAIFSSLKEVVISNCSSIKKLFPIELLQGLQNLQQINVKLCDELEEIIASEEEEKEKNDQGKATLMFVLHKLLTFRLECLPKLESICGRGVMIPAASLRYLRIVECPKLKKIALSLPLSESGQPSPPPSLKIIEAEPSEWWESVEWDQPNAKHVLSPFVNTELRLV